jgi:tellurite resistance protein
MSQFNSHIRSSVLRIAYYVLGLFYAQRATHPRPERSRGDASCTTTLLDPSTSSGQALSTFNCRVQLTRQKRDDSVFDAFTIEVAGSIRTAGDNDYATVQILISDVTDGPDKAKPVLSEISNFESWHGLPARENTAKPVLNEAEGMAVPPVNFPRPVFCYRADLGRLPNRVTTLSDWTTVAHLNLDWLLFPHKGKRILRFGVSLLSGQNGQDPRFRGGDVIPAKAGIAYAERLFICENPDFGYVDLQENVHRTKSLAVALAFAISAADNKLYHAEVQVIKQWAIANLLPSGTIGTKLEEALDHAVRFFQKGNQLDIYKVCKEIVELAPVSDRYDILDLCLQVARAKGTVAAEELTVLKYIATWLEVDMDRFREMMEKLLPVNIHQVKNTEVILGITPNMGRENTRRQLNRYYRKWNSRVTNADPEIQAQADQMLKLIAEARSQLAPASAGASLSPQKRGAQAEP